MIQIVQLIWDDWNVEHIARHKVTPKEVEEVCAGNPFWAKTYGGRLRVIGLTLKKRALTAILAPKGKDIFYPITARSASRKERRLLAEISTKEVYDK